jgi:hypothetical protein
MTHGGRGGLAGVLAVVLQGVAFYYLPTTGLIPPLAPVVLGSVPVVALPAVSVVVQEIDQTARLLNVNAYLLCFGLASAVHEYCRAYDLVRLRVQPPSLILYYYYLQ